MYVKINMKSTLLLTNFLYFFMVYVNTIVYRTHYEQSVMNLWIEIICKESQNTSFADSAVVDVSSADILQYFYCNFIFLLFIIIN